MLLRWLFLFLSTTAIAGGGRIADGNAFYEFLLSQRTPHLVATFNLDPYALQPFDFVVLHNKITNRDLTVHFTINCLNGLTNGVAPYGNCAAPGYRNGVIVVGCNLSLRRISVSLQGTAYGDALIGSKIKAVEGSCYLGNSYILVEIEANHANEPDGQVVKIDPKKIDISCNYTTTLDLNDDRWTAFRDMVRQNVETQVIQMLNYPYKAMLNEALKTINIPDPNLN